MNGLNRATLLGNLGADPELRYTNGGVAVLTMRLATSRTYITQEGEKKDVTFWHQIVVWKKRAEALSKLLAKGDRIYVEGEIQTTSYEHKGETRWKTEIVARDVILAGGKRAPGRPPQPEHSDDDVPDDERRGGSDDIPF